MGNNYNEEAFPSKSDPKWKEVFNKSLQSDFILLIREILHTLYNNVKCLALRENMLMFEMYIDKNY